MEANYMGMLKEPGVKIICMLYRFRSFESRQEVRLPKLYEKD